jgi:hypothetical protein
MVVAGKYCMYIYLRTYVTTVSFSNKQPAVHQTNAYVKKACMAASTFESNVLAFQIVGI